MLVDNDLAEKQTLIVRITISKVRVLLVMKIRTDFQRIIRLHKYTTTVSFR